LAAKAVLVPVTVVLPLVTATVPDLYQGIVVPYPKGNGRFAVVM
jgi:hypothetical protein